jgi:hypothetical protein
MIAIILYSRISHNYLAFRDNEFADLVISLLLLDFFTVISFPKSKLSNNTLNSGSKYHLFLLLCNKELEY